MSSQSKSYRPELHYMRGPGPKWREKNGVPTFTASGRRAGLRYASWLIPAAAAVLMATVTALVLA